MQGLWCNVSVEAAGQPDCQAQHNSQSKLCSPLCHSRLTCTSTPDMRFSSRRSSAVSSSAPSSRPGPAPPLPLLVAGAAAAASPADAAASPADAASSARGVAAAEPGAALKVPTRIISTTSSNWGRRRWRSVSARLAQSAASGSGHLGGSPANSHCSQVPTFWLKKTRRLGLRLRACRKRSPAAAERNPSHLPCRGRGRRMGRRGGQCAGEQTGGTRAGQ